MSSAKSGKAGQTVEYKIVVKNTGNLPLKFAALKDSGCSGITPSGATELAVGAEESFTCSNTLAVGANNNEASIEGNEGTGTKTSNKVTTTVASEPTFSIEKFQKIAGEPTYTTSKITGSLGQTVEYKVVVTNTGNVPLKFAALKDTGCEGVTPPGTTELAAGKSENFTCTPHARGGREIHQRSLDRRQRRHRHQDLQQSRSQSRRRTELHDRKAPADRGRTDLRRGRSQRQTRPDRRIRDRRQEHRQRDAQIRAPSATRTARGISPSGATELKAGKEEIFTCSAHAGGRLELSNEASIEGNEGTGEKDLQQSHRQSRPPNRASRSKSSSGSKAKAATASAGKTGKLSQIVEYEIVVKNTGNVALKFAALEDAGCEGLTAVGRDRTCGGKEESFTCSHTLGAVGCYTNEASIEGNEGTGTKTSNKVTAKVAAEPAFTIEKQQKIAGEVSYTSGEVTGKVGQTVEYKVTVKNTGNVKLKFAALKDSGCEGVTPSGATELEAGKEESFTCTHVLAVGSYTNEASIEGNEGTGVEASNKVTAKVPAEPSFLIEKQQRIAGEGTYTSAEHTGKLGQIVEYKIIVRNTGNVTLKFAAIKDTGCEGLSPSGATEAHGRRQRRVLHLHAHARLRRQLQQRSLDRRQRRDRHQDLQQGHDQSRRRTVLRDRKAAEDRRRRHLRRQRSCPANWARPSNTR